VLVLCWHWQGLGMAQQAGQATCHRQPCGGMASGRHRLGAWHAGNACLHQSSVAGNSSVTVAVAIAMVTLPARP
jgi:hypothetical protein